MQQVEQFVPAEQFARIQQLRPPVDRLHIPAERRSYLQNVAASCTEAQWDAVLRALNNTHNDSGSTHGSWHEKQRAEAEFAANYELWDERAAAGVVSEVIREDARAVLDIGAGKHMHLQRHLKSGVLYYPADLLRWSERTIDMSVT